MRTHATHTPRRGQQNLSTLPLSGTVLPDGMIAWNQEARYRPTEINLDEGGDRQPGLSRSEIRRRQYRMDRAERERTAVTISRDGKIITPEIRAAINRKLHRKAERRRVRIAERHAADPHCTFCGCLTIVGAKGNDLRRAVLSPAGLLACAGCRREGKGGARYAA